MILFAQAFIFLLAFAGVVAGSLGMIFFAGGAMNRARPDAVRLKNAGIALLCLCGIVASAAAGFVGVPALLYFAAQ